MGLDVYSDSSCQIFQSVSAANASFTTCRPTSVLGINVTNMMSFRGHCSTSTQMPLSSSAMVSTTYALSQVCLAPQDQFKAYTLDSCFGTNEGTSSIYSYSSSRPDTVTMTSYYNANCNNSLPSQVYAANLSLTCFNNSGQVNRNTSTQTSVYLSPGSSDDGLSEGEVAGIAVAATVVGIGMVAAAVYVGMQSSAAAAAAGAGTGASSSGVAVGVVGGTGPTANPLAAASVV